MKLKELLAPLDVLELHADPELDITGISYDSRTTKPGELFVAVTGFAADGHKFIPKAVERGAAAILCERAPEADIPYVVAGSTRRALALVSAAWFGHPADKMTMLGVTGTNGKTTITYLLKTVLEKTLGAKVGLIGTIQNMIGDTVIHTERTTPESFELQKLFAEMYAAGCTHVIMEVSSHALVLHRADQIAFRVVKDATKKEVKDAVELLFKVQVESVQVINLKGKQKRFGRFEGRRSDVRKAYVCLKPGQDINFAQEVK